MKLGREFAKLPTMRTGDLIINGEAVPSSTASDTVSPTGGDKANNLGSAIARAAAINEVSDRTGVIAVVQKNVVTGTAMDPALNSTTTGRGTVTINGYITGVITTTPNNVRASREETVRQINKISHLTGVVATDTGVDAQGVTLTAADGRNIEVAFNTANTTKDFAALTGLKQGISVGSYALESKVEQQIMVTSAPAGDITTTGLRIGDYTQNISREITSDRAAAYSPVAKVVKVTPVGAVATSITLNGIKIDVANAAQGAQATALASSINSDTTLKAKITATAVGNDVFITAKDPGWISRRRPLTRT